MSKKNKPEISSFLLSVIACLLTVSVAMQSFFVSKLWSHENRITIIEQKQIYDCNKTK